jgi:PIN domain nuclease of toxin-antitoxin system
MNFLLDTHTFLWWIINSKLLSKTAREIMSDGYNVLFWSAASSWEIAIKYALSRIPLPDIPEKFIPEELARNNIDSLPITDEHAFHVGQLPPHHKDPFDRMLVAQAQTESLILLSSDRQLNLYDVQIRW